MIFAAALSMNKTIFRRANINFHTEEQFNEIVRSSFLGEYVTRFFSFFFYHTVNVSPNYFDLFFSLIT